MPAASEIAPPPAPAPFDSNQRESGKRPLGRDSFSGQNDPNPGFKNHIRNTSRAALLTIKTSLTKSIQALNWTGVGDRIVAPGERLLVLPEGIMINYLMRRLTPLRTAHFFAGALYDGREAAVVEQLKRSPPEWVLLLSRDLREYGVDRYGESPGHGEFLLRWMLANYSLEARTGADPLDPNKYGARYYKRMPHPASGDVSVR